MSTFILKILAYIFMFVDHVKYAFPSLDNDFTLYLGRISFPLFVFCIVQGYIHTKDFGKYVKRLIIFALISQVPFSLFCSLPTLDHPEGLNVLFTLAIGVVALKAWDIIPNYFLKILSVLALGSLAEFGETDYGLWGVLFIVTIYICSDTKLHLFLGYVVIVLSKYIGRIVYWEFYKNISLNYDYTIKMCLCTLFPIVFIILYNGKSGTKKLNKFFYLIYPVHLLLFWALSPYTLNY